MKDTLKTLGATNHTAADYERSARDYYGTDPKAVQALLLREHFNAHIWEPCAGHNIMAKEIKEGGYDVRTTDIYDYGYGHEILDFLSEDNNKEWNGDIIMNPPYYAAEQFVNKALSLVKPKARVAVFLKTLFLEGQKRYANLFAVNPPKYIYVFSGRQVCSKVDDFTVGSAVSYSWFIWEKGFTGEPIIRWIV